MSASVFLPAASLPAAAAELTRLDGSAWPRQAGASVVVKFSVDVASELKLLGRDFKWIVEAGDW